MEDLAVSEAAGTSATVSRDTSGIPERSTVVTNHMAGFVASAGGPHVAITSVPRDGQKRTWAEKWLITPGRVEFLGRTRT